MKNNFSKILSLILFFSLFFNHFLIAQENSVVSGIVHEAYLPAITGISPLESILTAPPPLLNETPAPQQDPLTIWIPGYWSWWPERNDFVWVSGVWRRSPPGQIWISGYWRSFLEGWIYIPGFWSPKAENDLTYLPLAPPDTLQEDLSNPPANNYFWNPGFWIFIPKINDYIWISGKWKPIDSQWILVPAHYQWREEGYVFIPAFWDWSLERRGQVYQTMFIPLENRYAMLYYTPVTMIDPHVLVFHFIPYYPNYLYFYYHYVHFHLNIWRWSFILPPWWAWKSWWTLNWQNHWALWWWYTHPGYPQPTWMTSAISQLLPPLNPSLMALTQNIDPPLIVTHSGILPSNELLPILSQEYSWMTRLPLVPANYRRRLLWTTPLTIKTASPILYPTRKNFLENTKNKGIDFHSSFASNAPLLIFKENKHLSAQQFPELSQYFQEMSFPSKPSQIVLQKEFNPYIYEKQKLNSIYPLRVDQWQEIHRRQFQWQLEQQKERQKLEELQVKEELRKREELHRQQQFHYHQKPAYSSK